MTRRVRKIIAFALCIVVSLGFVSPASARPAGTPWKDWFIAGELTERDKIRLQDDYYGGVERDWILDNNISGISDISTTTERENEIRDQMLDLIENPNKGSKQNAQDLQNLRGLYELYEDWDARDADGLKPLEPLVKRLKTVKNLDELTAWLTSDDLRLCQSWHVNDSGRCNGVSLFGISIYTLQNDEYPDESDGARISSKRSSDGLGAAIDTLTPSEELAATNNQTTGYVLEIDPPNAELSSFMIDEEDLSDEDTVEAYRQASSDIELAWWMLDLLGYSEDETDEILSDAIALDSVMLESMTDGSDSYEECSLSELEQKTKDGFPIATIVRAYGYDDAESYAVYDMKWLEAMNDYYSEDNLSMLKSHALVGLLIDSASILNTDAYDAYVYADGSSFMPEEYLEKELEGNESYEFTDEELKLYEQERGRQAMTVLQSSLPTSYAKLYVENYYDESMNDAAKALVERIRDEYAQMLKDEEWLSEKTRNFAIEKLEAMSIHVGYPSIWPDTSGIDVRSRAKGGTLFDEVRRLRGYDLSQELRLLRNPSEGEYWSDCMDVNAYYLPTMNSVTIGAGVLGGAFWPKDASEEEILAGTGVTIGHEMSHAFDADGAYFDKHGAYDNWWTTKDLEAFEERVERVKDYFDRIDPLGTGSYDGNQICSEAIADLGGMKVVMRLAKQDKDFDYDKFFRFYANSWARVMSLDDATAQLATDSHPLDRDRVNVPVRECDEFFETYDITKSDGMWLDAKDRISVW